MLCGECSSQSPSAPVTFSRGAGEHPTVTFQPFLRHCSKTAQGQGHADLQSGRIWPPVRMCYTAPSDLIFFLLLLVSEGQNRIFLKLFEVD